MSWVIQLGDCCEESADSAGVPGAAATGEAAVRRSKLIRKTRRMELERQVVSRSLNVFQPPEGVVDVLPIQPKSTGRGYHATGIRSAERRIRTSTNATDFRL